MGTHSWAETCPHCGYEGMDVWTDTYDSHFAKHCHACGYDMHPTESVPSKKNIKLVKDAMTKMPKKKLSQLIMELTDNGDTLLDYLKDTAKEK